MILAEMAEKLGKIMEKTIHIYRAPKNGLYVVARNLFLLGSCLPVLPGPAWILLSKIYIPFFGTLYANLAQVRELMEHDVLFCTSYYNMPFTLIIVLLTQSDRKDREGPHDFAQVSQSVSSAHSPSFRDCSSGTKGGGENGGAGFYTSYPKIPQRRDRCKK